ncbi:hypothetical protein PROFUN_08069 [Planoprotostelium fungivorum]|uniref:Uncharacterized protein n=1 Tax=Planoprotostelium fungivorum TaxID=1890364 RepID=A0A2P6NKJ8_9EUKA|nr:hypothetical protein PROFUN_08069 [Planoprotostelium fungivorum]
MRQNLSFESDARVSVTGGDESNCVPNICAAGQNSNRRDNRNSGVQIIRTALSFVSDTIDTQHNKQDTMFLKICGGVTLTIGLIIVLAGCIASYKLSTQQTDALKEDVSGSTLLDLPSYGSSTTITIQSGSSFTFRAVDQNEVPAGVLTIQLLDSLDSLHRWTAALGSLTESQRLSIWYNTYIYFCALEDYITFTSNTPGATAQAKITMGDWSTSYPSMATECNYGERMRAKRGVGIAGGVIGGLVLFGGCICLVVGLVKGRRQAQMTYAKTEELLDTNELEL